MCAPRWMRSAAESRNAARARDGSHDEGVFAQRTRRLDRVVPQLLRVDSPELRVRRDAADRVAEGGAVARESTFLAAKRALLRRAVRDPAEFRKEAQARAVEAHLVAAADRARQRRTRLMAQRGRHLAEAERAVCIPQRGSMAELVDGGRRGCKAAGRPVHDAVAVLQDAACRVDVPHPLDAEALTARTGPAIADPGARVVGFVVDVGVARRSPDVGEDERQGDEDALRCNVEQEPADFLPCIPCRSKP